MSRPRSACFDYPTAPASLMSEPPVNSPRSTVITERCRRAFLDARAATFLDARAAT